MNINRRTAIGLLTSAGVAAYSEQTRLRIRRLVSGGGGGGGEAVLWELDEDSTAVDGNGALLFGLDSRWGTQTTPPTFDDYTMAKVVGGGPSGQDSVRFTYDNGGFASQGYLGGQKTVTAPVFNTSIFLRGRIRVNFSPDDEVHTCKHLIIANVNGSNRPILTWGTHFGPPDPLQLKLQIDGGANQILGARFDLNEWQDWQIELFPGTSSGAGNGYYKIWTDNNVYASPNDSFVGLTFVTGDIASWGEASWGFFQNDIASGDLVVDVADWQYGTTFDAAW